MRTKNIILILLNYFSLSFQIIQSAFFCDDRIQNVYVYNKSTGTYKFLLKVEDPKDCFNPDYIDLDVDPGDIIKFECFNGAYGTLGGGCFLINNQCRCYDFEIKGHSIDFSQKPREFKAKFNNNITCNHKVNFVHGETYTSYDFYHTVPLDAFEINCKPKNISAPINIKNSLKFSEFIDYPYNLTNLNITIMKNLEYFTLNSQPIYGNNRFNILNDLEYFSKQSSKINIQFVNFGVVLNTAKVCEFNIRFCYNSCLECNDIDPNETSHQCSKCKDGFYKIENTNNCMTINQMKDNHSYYLDRKEKIFKLCYNSCSECNDIEPNETSHQCLDCKKDFYKIDNTNNCISINQTENSHYYFDGNETIFKQCINNCSSCNNATYCKTCTKGYHFIYNEEGKCINETEGEDLFYLDEKTNTYMKCEEGTVKVENNKCIKSSNITIIIILIIVILIIIIALFFFIKKCVSRKKLENEISTTLEKDASDNQLLNIYL